MIFINYLDWLIWLKQLLVLKEQSLLLIFYWQTKNTRLKTQTHLKVVLVISFVNLLNAENFFSEKWEEKTDW